MTDAEFRTLVARLMAEGHLFGTAVILARYDSTPAADMPEYALAWKVVRRPQPQA